MVTRAGKLKMGAREWRTLAVVMGALLLLLALSIAAHATSGMFGVGRMMGPDPNGGGTPGGGFAIVTGNNSPLTTGNNSVLVTGNHP